jgi:iron complex transport system substrate-binding protein
MKPISVVILSMLVLGACSSPPSPMPAADTPMSQPDGLGRQVTEGQAATRIVSLAPSNTEMLFAVGAGPQLVGRDSFSDYPAEAARIPDVGGGFAALNMELIVSAKPDLVLASPLTPPEQLADLKNVGLRVEVVPNPSSFEALFLNILSVGTLTGHEAQSQSLVSELKQRVATVTSKVANTEKPLVYYELDATDPSAPYTSGPGTFVNLLIESAGGQNFGAGLSGEWVQVSVEALLARQPDFIVLGDYTYGAVTPEQVRARAGWDALNAVQQNQIFTFDDNLVSRPGPRLVDGLEAMARLLHPDVIP